MTDLEKAREFFAKDIFACETTGVVIEEVKEHYAKCSLKIEERHKNAHGGVMGGAIFTLADCTFAVASNFNSVQTVSFSSTISFVGVAKGKNLIAESTLVKDGKTTCLYSINVTDELGTEVAFVTISGVKIVK